MSRAPCAALLLSAYGLSWFMFAHAQLQNSWPEVYPGMPSGNYSPEWQNCTCCYLFPALTLRECFRRLSGDKESSKRIVADCSELGRQHPRAKSGSSE